MAALTLSEFTYYSPVDDAEMTRVSIADDRGVEFFANILAGEGKSYRLRKEAAIDGIVSYIEGGGEPGEVVL